MPVARSTASGNFAGWAVASETTGVAGDDWALSGGADADCAVRIKDEAALAIDAGHFRDAGRLVERRR